MDNDIEKFTLLLKELKRVYSSYVSEMCYARDNWNTVADNDIARAEDPYEKTWALNDALYSIESIDRILSGKINSEYYYSEYIQILREDYGIHISREELLSYLPQVNKIVYYIYIYVVISGGIFKKVTYIITQIRYNYIYYLRGDKCYLFGESGGSMGKYEVK